MRLRKLSYWALLFAAGCDGKLVVDRGEPSASSGGGGEVGDSGGAAGDSRGAAGGSAGAPIPPDTGTIGKACMPAGLVVESEGTAAEATLEVLARCDAGLSCSAQGKCAAAPNCQQGGDGACVLRRAKFDQSIYDGLDQFAYTGIVDLTANDSHVYWVEYGTRDALGNYQHDGALMSYRIADGTTTTVASGLDGPNSLALTTTHAYIAAGDKQISAQMQRVNLGDGSVEQVPQDQFFNGRLDSFAAAGSQAFWSTATDIYTLSAHANAVPTLFFKGEYEPIYPMASDGTDLFCLSSHAAVLRTAVGDANPTPTGASVAHFGFALHGHDLFKLEGLPKVTASSTPSGILLWRASKSGGDFQQVRALGAGQPIVESLPRSGPLRAVGDRYFFSAHEWVQDRDGNYGYQRRVLTAGFDDDQPPIRLLELPRQFPVDHFLWVGTATALYWSDGQAIYEQPLPGH